MSELGCYRKRPADEGGSGKKKKILLKYAKGTSQGALGPGGDLPAKEENEKAMKSSKSIHSLSKKGEDLDVSKGDVGENSPIGNRNKTRRVVSMGTKGGQGVIGEACVITEFFPGGMEREKGYVTQIDPENQD